MQTVGEKDNGGTKGGKSEKKDEKPMPDIGGLNEKKREKEVFLTNFSI